MKRFGVMLDMSRNAVMKPKEVKEFAKIIKSYGYNMIQLYTEDTYEIEGEPYFGYLRGRYTQAELCEIVESCEEIGVEVIPCIQTLAHLNQIFKWPVYSSVNDVNDILLCREPRTYEFIDKMFVTVKKCFRSDIVHIGMDEAHMLGLGKYLDKYGYENRFEILCNHLRVVSEMAEKHGLKPIMWSDMFFRLGNNGNARPEDPKLAQEVIDITPKNVGLVYWDYYNTEKVRYDVMFEAHKRFPNEIWFAGGSWTWGGLCCSNSYSLKSMKPAMLSAKDCDIENILITMWGDNGKEASFYSVLPALYATKRFYDGETDMEKIKAEFAQLSGESFDDMLDLDLPNMVGGNTNGRNGIAKAMLYSDPFLGFFDSGVRDGAAAEYAEHAKKLACHASSSKNYGYIFESASALCNILALKYDFGIRARRAYTENDKEALSALADECTEINSRLEIYLEKQAYLWNKENKPHGFEVQDLRIGGLIQRMKRVRSILKSYAAGEISSIPELEEKILDWYGGGEEFNKEKYPSKNIWSYIATPNIL